MKKLLILIGLPLFAGVCQAQLSFSESAQTLGSAGFACLSGDLNNDGNLDIYIVKRDKPDEIWFNNGKGNFTISTQKIGNSIKFNRNIDIADLNGDSIPDVFIANDADLNNVPSDGLPNEVWFNDGKGKFTDSGQRLGKKASMGVALGDIDGDGDIDAVIANLHSTDYDNIVYQPNEVWLNDGKGNFTNSGQTLGTGGSVVKLVDIDSDGDLDPVFQSQADNKFIIWLNDGKGNFTQSSQSIGNGTNIAFGDLDGDGDMDAFIVKGSNVSSAPCEVWLNDGKGKFTDSGQRLGNSVGYYVALGDMDGDGDLDAVVTNGLKDAQPTVLWINQGGNQSGVSGTYKESGIVFSKSQIGQVKIGDLDKDGDLDIVISNYAGVNKIYFNNTVSTGIQDIKDERNSVKIYPNPSKGQFTINMEMFTCKQALIDVFNTNGSLIYSKTFRNATNMNIDLTGNATGIYIVKVIADGVSYEEKIVKE